MEQVRIVSLLMNPAGEKFEPTHVGCYGVSSGGFYPQISRMARMGACSLFQGEKFEPTDVGCYGISSGGFKRRWRG